MKLSTSATVTFAASLVVSYNPARLTPVCVGSITIWSLAHSLPTALQTLETFVLVCAEAHELITGRFIDVEGVDATKPIFFHWNEKAMKGRIKPFRIVGKRTAA